MEKLPISVGVLAWHSGQTLIDTLSSYHNNGLLSIVKEVTILFQEITDEDRQIANYFSLPYIGLSKNVGIGKAFIKLTEKAEADSVLLLEHDWLLVENQETTYNRLKSGLDLLNSGFNSIKYRHRKQPGYPLYTQTPYQGSELNHYDKEIDLISPHLLDSIHWLSNPDEQFADKIQKQGDYFITTSRWGNWTNNPCLFKKQFYIDNVSPFVGDGIELEGNIGGWWARQNFRVAQGEGLFMHRDVKKFGK